MKIEVAVFWVEFKYREHLLTAVTSKHLLFIVLHRFVLVHHFHFKCVDGQSKKRCFRLNFVQEYLIAKEYLINFTTSHYSRFFSLFLRSIEFILLCALKVWSWRLAGLLIMEAKRQVSPSWAAKSCLLNFVGWRWEPSSLMGGGASVLFFQSHMLRSNEHSPIIQKNKKENYTYSIDTETPFQYYIKISQFSEVKDGV